MMDYFVRQVAARLVILMFLIASQSVFASQPLTLAINHANLSDAIRLITKFLNINVIISPNVIGVATLNLTKADAGQAFDLLLASHGLAKLKVGNIWFVAPQEELIKQKQQETKWREVSDLSSPLQTFIWQVRYAKADDIGRLLQDGRATLLSKRGRVRVDMRTNIICIQDIAEHMDEIKRLIHFLDVPAKQILIEARLASVDSDYERELGISYAVNAEYTANNGISVKSIAEGAGHYSLAVVKLADGSQLDVKLSALEDAGHAELISRPSLFTANQQAASIEAGEEVPYQEVSESGGTAVTFKKAVLGLRVTPQVLPGNKVLLQLQINQDRPSSKMVLGVPTISTRQITTSVLVKAGQTIVLGGIFENNLEKGERRIPFVSQIPIIGELFTQRSTRQNRRELLIFVTPKIMT